MVRSILVPLDGSSFGEQALPLALNLARRSQALVRLVHVHVPIAALYNANEVLSDVVLENTLREQDCAYLQGVVKRVQRVAAVPVESTLLDGPVIGALLEHSANVRADLIVMTTHGRGPLSRFWLGGVADKMMRRGPTPILLVHPHDSAPSLEQQAKLERIIIPLDGSELAERVLEPAIELAGLLSAECTLLRAIEPILVAEYPLNSSVVGGVPEEFRRRVEEEARSYLQRVAERLRAKSISAGTRLVIDRVAADAILDESRSSPNSMIALATHGRGGLARMFLGSTADRVVRGATVPVLVYHPQ